MLDKIIICFALIKLFWPVLDSIFGIFKYGYAQLFPINLKNYGSWAIVTGSSDGIGQGYAIQLAKKGLKILLISRSEDKLKSVQAEIQKQYSVQVEYIVFDFQTDSYQTLNDIILHKSYKAEIAVLVNNVGYLPYAYENYADYVTKIGLSKIDAMSETNYKVNIKSQEMMTAIILPIFYEKKKGIIVNLSSIASIKPQPFWSLYGPAKTYNLKFSEAIRKEQTFDGYHNIIIQTVRPGIVLTNMAPKWAKESLRFPTVETFTRYAINTIGFLDVTYGYWFHALLTTFWIKVLGWYGEKLFYQRVLKIRQGRLKKLKTAEFKKED